MSNPFFGAAKLNSDATELFQQVLDGFARIDRLASLFLPLRLFPGEFEDRFDFGVGNYRNPSTRFSRATGDNGGWPLYARTAFSNRSIFSGSTVLRQSCLPAVFPAANDR